jgi:uncharacterized membrane protein YozB (DUF420 family)
METTMKETVEAFFWISSGLLTFCYLGMLIAVIYLRKTKLQSANHEHEWVLQWHKGLAITMTVLMFMLVIFIRIFDFDIEADQWLLRIHIPIATVFAVSLIAQIVKTGYRNSKRHRQIGYVSLMLYPLVAITGVMLFL